MDRHFVRALMFAWEQSRFRDGLRQLIDLDEISALLAALASGEETGQAERRLVSLISSALEEDEIRRAVLLLIEDPVIREEIKQGTASVLAARPGLAVAVCAALDDPAVRFEARAALESARVRSAVWGVVDSQLARRRGLVARQIVALLVRHRHARKLVLALNRHGLYGELWRARKAST